MKKVKLNAIIAAATAVIGTCSMIGGSALATTYLSHHDEAKAAVEKTEAVAETGKAAQEQVQAVAEKGEMAKEKAEAVAEKGEAVQEQAKKASDKGEAAAEKGGEMAKEKAKDGEK